MKTLFNIALIVLSVLLYSFAHAATLWYSENFDNQNFGAPPSGTVETWVSSTNGCAQSPWCPSTGATEPGHYDFLQTGRGGTGDAFGTASNPTDGAENDPYFIIVGATWPYDGFYIEWWIKFVNVVGESYQNYKIIYPHWSGSGTGYVMFNTIESTQGDERLYYSARDNTGALIEESVYIDVHGLQDGNWHKVGTEVIFSTSQIWMWYDVTTPTAANATFSRDYPDSAWAGASLYYFGPGLADEGDTSLWDYKLIDDFKIYDELPSGAPSPVNGVCGSNDGATLASLTSGDADNCSVGAVDSFSGTGPWTWDCLGTDGGTDDSCSASLQTALTTSIDPNETTAITTGTTSITTE